MSALLDDVSRMAVRIFPEIIAWHEAGHAILASAMGMTVSSLRMDRHTGNGATTAVGVWSPQAELLFSLAGRRSERLCPDSLGDIAELIPSAIVDEQRWNAALADISSDRETRAWLFDDATREVDQLLIEKRDLLDRLSRRLLQQRHLDGHDVRRLVGR